MTQSIERTTRERARRTPDAEPVIAKRPKLIVGVWCFTVGMTVLAVALTVAQLTVVDSVHLAIYAATCAVLAAIGGAVLSFRAMLAGRQEFYRRGHLDGWMRGWRGQEPEVDDPILR